MVKRSNRKISEALELLEEAALDKKHELQDMVQERYTALRDALVGAGGTARHRIGDVAQDARDAVRRQSQETVERLEDNVRDRPWTWLGSVAAGALFLGFLFGRRSAD